MTENLPFTKRTFPTPEPSLTIKIAGSLKSALTVYPQIPFAP